MFHCYIHNWSNHSWVCPECVQIATTASNDTTDAFIGVNLSHYRALEAKLTKAESDLKALEQLLEQAIQKLPTKPARYEFRELVHQALKQINEKE